MRLVVAEEPIEAQAALMKPTGDLQEYEQYMRGWGASPATIKARLVVSKRFLAGRSLGSITSLDVIDFLATPGYSPATRCTYWNHIKALFRWAVEEGMVDANPVDRVRRPRPPKGAPRPLSPVEAREVLATATGDLRAWLVLSMFAGLRAHEIAKIRGEDVTDHAIYVLGKGQHSAVLPTHPEVKLLREIYPEQGWWFPTVGRDGHILGSSLSGRVSRHFREHGVEGSIHRGRHTYGTGLLRSGANIRVVQELLRHGSLNTTQLYTAVDEDEMRTALMALTA